MISRCQLIKTYHQSTWVSFAKTFCNKKDWNHQTYTQKHSFASSSFCLKKHKSKHLHQKDAQIERLKSEAPFVYKASRNLENKSATITTQFEKPVIFLPLTAKEEDLVDHPSDLLHNLKIKPSLRKETVFIIQPNFKWGSKRFLTKLSHCRLDEAKALVESVHSWNVFSTAIESVHEHNPKHFFGSGKILELSEMIRTMINDNGVTMIFLNTGRLTLRQIKELEAAWGCKVFDRYRVVLELFKERASTKEAKLQVQLAEIQYLRTHLTSKDLHYDQQRGGGKGMMGSGETYMEKARRHLSDSEIKIKKALNHIKQQRAQVNIERVKKQIPQVALVGYTNAGKTTLAKVLSKDSNMNPEDKLFATLDTTAHRGKLPSGMNLLYIDTVGFISDLPHELVESFATTLEDLKTADVILHVSDCSHPEHQLQTKTVENVLEQLHLPDTLYNNMLHVLNKCDLRSESIGNTHDNQITISATQEFGLEELRTAIEQKVVSSTGRTEIKINVNQQGSELSWLYRYGTVIDTKGLDDGSLDIVAILDKTHRAKFEKEFKIKSDS